MNIITPETIHLAWAIFGLISFISTSLLILKIYATLTILKKAKETLTSALKTLDN